MTILNRKIPAEINKWSGYGDQNGFLTNEDWLKDAYLYEDILQLKHVNAHGPVLDVGFYTDRFRIYIIYDHDWENPREVFESTDPVTVSEKVYELLKKYAHG